MSGLWRRRRLGGLRGGVRVRAPPVVRAHKRCAVNFIHTTCVAEPRRTVVERRPGRCDPVEHELPSLASGYRRGSWRRPWQVFRVRDVSSRAPLVSPVRGSSRNRGLLRRYPDSTVIRSGSPPVTVNVNVYFSKKSVQFAPVTFLCLVRALPARWSFFSESSLARSFSLSGEKEREEEGEGKREREKEDKVRVREIDRLSR